MADIVILNPRFEPSYWGQDYMLPFVGAKSAGTTSCLALLAALTPAGHTVTVMDENVEEIDFERCARADIVALTGMSVQRARMTEILKRLKALDCFTVVGGGWITVSENYFGDLVDVKFVGEAEETWPQFLLEWAEGTHGARYEQSTRTDMTKVPTPDWSVLKMGAYLTASLQISRGCPFTCEFCDIITTFGRQPRLKTTKQVIAELEALKVAGVTSIFLVDDNLIGNKKAIKPILKDFAAWQRRNGFPFRVTTEASIDLADDPELVELMVDTGIRAVFVGVESPNEASLKETKKLQNVRKGRTMLEKIHHIQNRGLEVMAGMIVGFDNDDETIFRKQVEFIGQARVVNALVGMLYAIPKTPLHARLASEGRLDLDEANEAVFGTNVVPAGMPRSTLVEGYQRTLREMNGIETYFDRLDSLYLDAGLEPESARRKHLRDHPRLRLMQNLRWAALGALLTFRVLRAVDKASRNAYARRIWRGVRRRPQPIMFAVYAVKAAMHYHIARMADDFAAGRPVRGAF